MREMTNPEQTAEEARRSRLGRRLEEMLIRNRPQKPGGAGRREEGGTDEGR